MTSNETYSVKIKIEEEYDQVLVEDVQSDTDTDERCNLTQSEEQHCPSPSLQLYSLQTGHNNLQREQSRPGDKLREESPAVERGRGSQSPTGSMASELEDESLFDDDNRMETGYGCSDPRYEAESGAVKDSFGTDHLRTLGEILAYCQVMYGAIQKLDEKLEDLQAKVTNIQAVHVNPALHQQATQKAQLLCSSTEARQHRNVTQSAAETTLPMPQLVRVSSPPPLLSGDSKKPPTLSPAPGVPSPPRLAPQSHPNKMTKAVLAAHCLPMDSLPLKNAKQLQISPPTTEGDTVENNSYLDKTRWLGNRKRKVLISRSVLQTADRMARPGAAVRFLLRSIFSLEELISSNTMGDPTRGLKKLDSNKITAIREWAAKRYPTFDLRERGKDWRACVSVINSTARYLRLMAKKRKLKKPKESGAVFTPFNDLLSDADSEPKPAAEIDVELSDSDVDGPVVSGRRAGSKDQKAIRNNSKTDCEREQDASNTPYVFLGNPHRGVRVPDFAMSTACQRARPELVARFLIKYIFPEDVLVRSNVYGNAEHGIQALDHNKISALREHLVERFPWLLLEEDGQDWRACVGAINSTIRKFRHERKKGRTRKKGH